MRTQPKNQQQSTPPPLGRFDRRVRDVDGRQRIVFDEEAHGAWLEKWLRSCPDGKPQRVREALGFRERNIGELELRVALGGGDEHGVCDAIVDEQDDEVFVRVLICYDEDAEWVPIAQREYTDCPVRVWLDKPLGERAVIDVDSDEELPFFIPAYRDGVPDPRHGYYPSNRRRRSREDGLAG